MPWQSCTALPKALRPEICPDAGQKVSCKCPQIVRSIVTNGGELYHISASLPSLEDLYFRLTETRKEHA